MIIKTIIWVWLIYCMFKTMEGGTWEGPVVLLFAWFLLYGVPLYFYMKEKQVDFELREGYFLKDMIVSQMFAFLTSDPSKNHRFKNFSGSTMEEKFQFIKGNSKI